MGTANESEVSLLFQISLEAARVNANMTQKDAASSINVNVSTISNWEKGRTAPSAEQFRRLCEVYSCPMDVIFLRR